MSKNKTNTFVGTYSFSFPTDYSVADVMRAFTAQNGKTVNDLKMMYFMHQDKYRIIHCLKGFKFNPDTLEAEEKLSYVYFNDSRDDKGWSGEYVGLYEDFGIGLNSLMESIIELGSSKVGGFSLGELLRIKFCKIEFEEQKTKLLELLEILKPVPNAPKNLTTEDLKAYYPDLRVTAKEDMQRAKSTMEFDYGALLTNKGNLLGAVAVSHAETALDEIKRAVANIGMSILVARTQGYIRNS